MPRTLAFPPFEIPTDVDLLYCAGVPVALEPRAVQLLRYLVTHRDRVVSKDELLDQVWAGVVTTDAVLKKAISKVRQALGDSAETPRYVETYHGRGYRFVGLPAAEGRAAGGTPLPDRTAERTPDFDRIVGREAEMGLLREALRRTSAGEGQTMLVLGEAGVGKTHLLRFFAHWASAQQARVLYAPFSDNDASQLAPFEVFLDLLHEAIGTGADRLDRAGRDARLRRALADRFGIALPASLLVNGDGDEWGGAAGLFGQDSFRAIGPVGDSFRELSRECPLVLVLDDVQWADEASRTLLGYLMRRASRDPILLVLLARIDDAQSPETALGGWLRRQAVYRGFSTITLPPLDPGACRDAIAAFFGPSVRVPEPDLAALHRLTGGNPYFLVETLRLLMAEGVVGVRDGTWRWHGIEHLHLPESVALMALAKLDRLAPAVREVVEQAAAIGPEFRVTTLARVAGLDEDALDRLLAEALRENVLSTRGVSTSEDYRFAHAVVRHVCIEAMGPRTKRATHARIAAVLEAAYAHEPDRVAEAISVHYESAGQLAPAFGWAMRAWQAARARWQWGEAAEAIGRAAALLDRCAAEGEPVGDEARLALYLGGGEVYLAAGRPWQSLDMLDAAAPLARRQGRAVAEGQALLFASRTRSAVGQYVEALRLVEEANRLFEQAGSEEVSAARLQRAALQVSLGAYADAIPPIEALLAAGGLHEELDAAARGLLGWSLALLGRAEEADVFFEAAIAYYTRVGDLRHRAHLQRRLQWTYLTRGRYQQAFRLAQRALDDFQAVGDAFGEAKTCLALGQTRVLQGLYGEGTDHLERALDKLRGVGDAHCEAEVLWQLGRAQTETGRLDEALHGLQRALQMVREIGDRDDEFRVLIDLSRLFLARGSAAEAHEAASSASRIAAALRNDEGEGQALVEMARALAQQQVYGAARDTVRAGVDALEAARSAERWRAYAALGEVLHRSEPARFEEIERAYARAVTLLEEILEPLRREDPERFGRSRHALAQPARTLAASLRARGRAAEADALDARWS